MGVPGHIYITLDNDIFNSNTKIPYTHSACTRRHVSNRNLKLSFLRRHLLRGAPQFPCNSQNVDAGIRNAKRGAQNQSRKMGGLTFKYQLPRVV